MSAPLQTSPTTDCIVKEYVNVAQKHLSPRSESSSEWRQGGGATHPESADGAARRQRVKREERGPVLQRLGVEDEEVGCDGGGQRTAPRHADGEGGGEVVLSGEGQADDEGANRGEYLETEALVSRNGDLTSGVVHLSDPERQRESRGGQRVEEVAYRHGV